MKGIQFVTDDNGEQTAVLIDLKEHRNIWEDFYDRLIALEREVEPRESIDEVEALLVKQGKLDA
jgi:hypothetical protein